MIPDALLILRRQMYDAWGVYHQALATYWNAISKRHPPENVIQVTDNVRITGALLDQALNALLQYLRQMEPSERRDHEIQRASRIEELLHHELELLE